MLRTGKFFRSRCLNPLRGFVYCIFRIATAMPGYQALQARLNPRSWVEKIAQCIADKVEGQNREHHRHCREEHEMRSIEEVGARVVQHRSPTRGRRRDA